MLLCLSSLLDVMAGRTDRKNVSGYVLINGDRQPENFKFASGYVVQVCVIMYLIRVCCH